MANRTDPLAASVHGTNPQNIMEKIVRMKIYDSMYWKEHCFGLTAETLVDKAADLRYASGTYGGARKPSEFLCLILKMLQIQPDKEIVIEFIRNEDHKYIRLLGAFYLRLIGKPLEVYRYLEPLYNDYRKIRLRNADGHYALSHMDEVIDEVLHKDYLFDIALPRIPRRLTLEKNGQLDKRISVLEEDFDEEAMLEEANRAAEAAEKLQQDMMREAGEKEKRRSRSRSRERERWREKNRERSRSRERRRDQDRPRSRERDRERGRDRDRDDRERRDRDERKRRRSTSRDRDERRKDKKDKKKRDVEEVDVEIAEANALRARLGLRPLK